MYVALAHVARRQLHTFIYLGVCIYSNYIHSYILLHAYIYTYLLQSEAKEHDFTCFASLLLCGLIRLTTDAVHVYFDDVTYVYDDVTRACLLCSLINASLNPKP